MKKVKVNFTLTPEAKDQLHKLADENGLKMSTVLELLIRGNKGIKFNKGVK